MNAKIMIESWRLETKNVRQSWSWRGNKSKCALNISVKIQIKIKLVKCYLFAVSLVCEWQRFRMKQKAKIKNKKFELLEKLSEKNSFFSSRQKKRDCFFPLSQGQRNFAEAIERWSGKETVSQDKWWICLLRKLWQSSRLQMINTLVPLHFRSCFDFKCLLKRNYQVQQKKKILTHKSTRIERKIGKHTCTWNHRVILLRSRDLTNGNNALLYFSWWKSFSSSLPPPLILSVSLACVILHLILARFFGSLKRITNSDTNSFLRKTCVRLLKVIAKLNNISFLSFCLSQISIVCASDSYTITLDT